MDITDTQSLGTQNIHTNKKRVFPASPSVPEIFERLMQEHRRRRPDAAAVAGVWLEALLLEVLRNHAAHATHAQASQARRSGGIQRAMNWMQERVERSYPLAEAAAAAGLQLSQFHARFQAETGFTPGEYRTRLRIDRAKRLLRGGELSVTEVAHRLEFSTSQYFATTFHRYTAMTPRAYRRKVQQYGPG